MHPLKLHFGDHVDVKRNMSSAWKCTAPSYETLVNPATIGKIDRICRPCDGERVHGIQPGTGPPRRSMYTLPPGHFPAVLLLPASPCIRSSAPPHSPARVRSWSRQERVVAIGSADCIIMPPNTSGTANVSTLNFPFGPSNFNANSLADFGDREPETAEHRFLDLHAKRELAM